MNFTREPIIETIISPKDGFKLLVRSSKAGSAEEYFVDALEVVSFGRAFFFRSLERPKAFLVPTSDYEVLEVKETRVALKNVSHERSIKIGGGREGHVRHRERAPQAPKEEELAVSSDESEEAGHVETGTEQRVDKRRDRRRHRRRRSDDQEWTDRGRGQEGQQREAEAARPEEAGEGGGAQDEAKVSSSMFSSLFPPPPTLISETLSRYKEATEGTPNHPEEKAEKHTPVENPKEEPKKPSHEDDAGSTPLHRVHAPLETESFTTTHFSPLNGNGGFNQFF